MRLPDDVFFESFTFPFFDSAFQPSMAVPLANTFLDGHDDHQGKGSRGLYVHIPFCETICGFCPFVKTVPRPGQIDEYVATLVRECEMILRRTRVQQWMVNSIYFGGGTPSLLTPKQLSSILEAIRSNVRVTDDAEVTLELEPKSIDLVKLKEFRAAGINRVSFGVQSFDSGIRQMMNLTATNQQIMSAVSTCCEVFQNTNFDMIVGFPGQGTEQVDLDMRTAARSGIGSVSMYPFDYVTALPSLLDRIRDGRLPKPPSSSQRWEMFHRARDVLMQDLTAQNMYCFGRPESPKCRYMFETLYGGYRDQAIGLGCGSYSYLTGLIYQNDQGLNAYQDAVQRGCLPIARATPNHSYEKHFVYFPKRTYADRREASDLGIESWVSPRLDILENRGFIASEGELVRLTPKGERNYAQIMVFMLSEGQRRLYDRACDRLSTGLHWDGDGPTSSRVSVIRGPAAKSAMSVKGER
jgi:coproporphyrinogen III oxidase-like Fe-S oxidoreductase